MKKILKTFAVIVAITTIIISCENRKLKNEVVPGPTVIVDSVSFEINQESDTIKTYITNNGEYTIQFKCFDKNKQPLKNVKLPIKLLSYEGSGVSKINTTNIVDTSFYSDRIYSMKYYPVAEENKQHSFKTIISNTYGKTFIDTVSYYVFKYNPIAFRVVPNPTIIPFVRPNSNFTFKINLQSDDITNQMQYKVKFELPYNTVKILQGPNDVTKSDAVLLLGDNEFKAELTNHPVGSGYNIRIKVFDQNGDYVEKIITYSVKVNETPVITELLYTWIQNFSINGLIKNGQVPAPNKGGPSCYNYTSIDNIYDIKLNLDISFSDDVKVTKIKVRGSNYSTEYDVYNGQVNYNAIISNGLVTYRYPNESLNGDCFRAYPSVLNYYNNNGNLYPGQPFIGISNNGTNIPIPNLTRFNIGSYVYISVQDSEGAWSPEKSFQIDVNSLKGPAKWAAPF